MTTFPLSRSGTLAIIAMALGITLTACGGSSAPVTLDVSANQSETSAAGDALVLNANLAGSNGAISWQLKDKDPGSLDKNSGNSVRYLPPAAGSVDEDKTVTITAMAAGVSREFRFTLHPSPGVYMIAGSLGGPGNLDGAGSAARFFALSSLALDPKGNLYIGDGVSKIRKMGPDGLVTKLTGDDLGGSTDGDKDVAALSNPGGMYSNGSGNLYFLDIYGLRLASSDGAIRSIYRNPHEQTPAQSLVRDSQGNFFYFLNAAIYRVTPGGQISVVAGNPAQADFIDGPAIDARFSLTGSLTIDAADNLYIADTGNCVIRRLDTKGIVVTWSGSPCSNGYSIIDGEIHQARYNKPSRITSDPAGNKYVYDSGYIRKIWAATQLVTTVSNISPLVEDIVAKTLPGDITPAAIPRGFHDFAADWQGNLFIAADNMVYKMTDNGNTTLIAGAGRNYQGSVDGIKGNALFSYPEDMTRDAAGNLYVIDNRWHVSAEAYLAGLVLRKITPDGTVTTLAGPGIWWGQADTADTFRKFGYPQNLSIDNAGNIYVSDVEAPGIKDGKSISFGQNALKKISPNGTITSLGPYTNGGGCKVRADGTGNLYFTTYDGIQKLRADGTLQTLLSNHLWYCPLTVTGAGDLYVFSNFGGGLAKIDAKGNISQLPFSSHVTAADGSIWSVGINSLVLDSKGVLYAADWMGPVFRIGADGQTTLMAGQVPTSNIRTGNSNPFLGNRLGQNSSLSSPNSLVMLNDSTLALIAGQAILKVVIPK